MYAADVLTSLKIVLNNRNLLEMKAIQCYNTVWLFMLGGILIEISNYCYG